MDQFLNRQSIEFKVPVINLREFTLELGALEILGEEFIRTRRVCPIHRVGASLVVAMSNPGDMKIRDEMAMLTGLKIEVCVCSDANIDWALAEFYDAAR